MLTRPTHKQSPNLPVAAASPRLQLSSHHTKTNCHSERSEEPAFSFPLNRIQSQQNNLHPSQITKNNSPLPMETNQ
jgi:hypothetical protein